LIAGSCENIQSFARDLVFLGEAEDIDLIYEGFQEAWKDMSRKTLYFDTGEEIFVDLVLQNERSLEYLYSAGFKQ
jgi:hypothetical protein